MSRTLPYDAILFDIGGTLLDVPHDPHRRLLERLAPSAVIPLDAWRVAIEQAVQEWHDAGGTADAVDLTATWVAHFTRALGLLQFPGDAAAIARDLEHRI